MRKKFGDWLLDIAKYMATAILLTSIFDEIRESWISYVSVSIAIILSLIVGLNLFSQKTRKRRINNNGNNRYLCIGFSDSHCRSDIFQDTRPQRTESPQSLINRQIFYRKGQVSTPALSCFCSRFFIVSYICEFPELPK